MSNTIEFLSSIKKVGTLADGSLDIVVNTQELPEEHMAIAFKMQKQGQFMACFAPIGEPIEKLEPVLVDTPKQKTPSQRLRGVLYKLFEQNNEGLQEFEQFYNIKMNTLVEYFKSKLD